MTIVEPLPAAAPPQAVQLTSSGSARPSTTFADVADALHGLVLRDLRFRPFIEGLDLKQVATAHRRFAAAELGEDHLDAERRTPDGGWYPPHVQEWMHEHLLHAVAVAYHREGWPRVGR